MYFTLIWSLRSYVINTERSRESESSANGTERRLGPGERVTQRRSPDARDRYAYSISYGNPRGIKRKAGRCTFIMIYVRNPYGSFSLNMIRLFAVTLEKSMGPDLPCWYRELVRAFRFGQRQNTPCMNTRTECNSIACQSDETKADRLRISAIRPNDPPGWRGTRSQLRGGSAR